MYVLQPYFMSKLHNNQKIYVQSAETNNSMQMRSSLLRVYSIPNKFQFENSYIVSDGQQHIGILEAS